MIVGLAAFLMLANAWSALDPSASGIPVLLSHQCTRQQLMNRGDGIEVFVRYRLDHSSLVNGDLMPVEKDLRRQIRTIMATRWEQVLFFSADESLPFGEVAKVLADFRTDDPALWIVILPKGQMNSVGPASEYLAICLTGPIPA
jgi:biopolymer transport protein ExbD